MEFIHLPPYDEYLSQWINLAAVESVIKIGEERVCVNFTTDRKQVYSGIWARIIVDYLGESEFKEAMASYRYLDEPA